MGEIKLLDILQTLCIGVYSLTLIVFFYFLYNKCFVHKKFNEKEFFDWLKDDVLKGDFKTGYLSLAVLLVYFLGILASDLTERMTDSNNNKERSVVLQELNTISFMPNVGHIRKLTLVDSEDSLTTLGNSVFNSYPLVLEANQINKSSFFLNKKDTSLLSENQDSLVKRYLKDTRFDRFISLLYYSSKNWCYSKEHEPLQELKSIQNRIDLSRSIVLLTAVAFQLLILFYLVFFLVNVKSVLQLSAKRGKELTASEQQFKSLFKNVNALTAKSLLAFLLTAILCRECFQICLMSYNKRAYGYYVSHVSKQTKDSTLVKQAGL